MTYEATGISLAGNGATVITLPQGFRPSADRYVVGSATYAGVTGMYNFRINTSGALLTHVGSNTETAVFFRCMAFPL